MTTPKVQEPVDPRLAAVVAQHARTALLMGVDFMPAYRSGAARSPEAATEDVTRASAVVEAKRTEVLTSASEAPEVRVREGISPSTIAPGRRAEAQRRLDELRARYEKDAPHARFIKHFTNIVFGEGDPCARLMFVGEAPGEQEDLTGRPFVGRAGDLLQKMITAMGLTRESVYIANVLKVRPPNNATPTIEEAEASAPYLYEQIEIIAPEAIVSLGLPATRVLLSTSESMGRLRGLWATFTTPGGRQIPVMPTYHPAYLLRSYTTENRAKVWSDLLKVVERLGLPVRAAPKDQ